MKSLLTQDEILIKRMLEVLLYVRDTPTEQYNVKHALRIAQEAIEAAEERLKD